TFSAAALPSAAAPPFSAPSSRRVCSSSVKVQALGVLFNALNSPSMPTGWKVGEGDPCGESWKGITCDGSAVVSIDLSDNKIHDTIPYQLPPNLTSLNFAGNNLRGNLPDSISAMASLNYLLLCVFCRHLP
ncbi:hypothetical protein PIB30_052297, partial [Stylosanthes scabra]|nr:hypothetical protein [Stylosanthes scabra]